MLLRFAGPRLAASGDDLRPGPAACRRPDAGRCALLVGAAPLAPFPPDSPFAGLSSPDEVRVSRQVLAEPGPDLVGATLATLEDGTPLVTRAQRGKGRLILVHTIGQHELEHAAALRPLRRHAAADPGPGAGCRRPPRWPWSRTECSTPSAAWSSLEGALPPIPPTASPRPWPARAPAGPLWAGPGGEAAEEERTARSALNLQRAVPRAPAPGRRAARRRARGPYARAEEVDLAPWLLTLALLLALADLVIGYFLRGLRPASSVAPLPRRGAPPLAARRRRPRKARTA